MRISIHPAVALGAALIGCSLWLWLRSTHQMAHDLDAYMRTQVQNSHFSGVVLVSRAGDVLFEGGYGLADVEWGIPNHPNTKFPIASLSKQFTAVIIMKLQEQGKLHVTDPVEVHLDPIFESRYVGNYRVSSDINVLIALENGRLFATIGQIPKAEIYAASEREFFFKVFD